MGGSIWVESNGIEGDGASFHFTITVQEFQDLSETDAPDASALENKTILIVDDNKSSREALAASLKRLGIHPALAASGNEALALIKHGVSFDLGIIDLEMPETDGLALAELLLNRLPTHRLPLILLTTHSARVNAGDLAAFSACITKPIKFLPLVKAIGEALLQPSQKSPPASIEQPETHHSSEPAPISRILLVEDNATNQKVMTILLRNLGYTSDTVNNGLEALESIKNESYEIILMDCQMPVMDGYETTRKIRLFERNLNRKPAYIIAMTAYAFKGDRERCLSAGMDDYLSKPIRKDTLKKALRERSGPETLQAGGKSEESSEKPSVAPVSNAIPSDADESDDPDAILSSEFFDVALFSELKAMGGDEFHKVCDRYFSDAQDKIDYLRSAVERNASQEVDHLAHSLAGASSMLGLKALLTPLKVLEEKGKEGRLVNADVILTEIEKHIRVCKNALDHYFQLNEGVREFIGYPKSI